MDLGWRSFPTPAGWFLAPRPHAEEHRSTTSADASTAEARCDASRSMRAHTSARPHPSRRAHARSSLRNVSASALLRMRTNIACCKVHHTNSPSPSRGAFAAARAGWSDPCIFLFFRRFGIFHPRSHDLKQPAVPRSRGAFLRPGFCIVASLTPNRGVGGAPRDVRVRAKHPLGLHMTRQARRLRGALRPMTRDARLSALHRGVSFLRSFPRKRESSISRSPLSRGRAEGGLRHASLRIQDRL